MNRIRNNKGFSLIELAIGIAVVTILILGVAASGGIRDNARIQAAAGSVRTLRSAAENYLSNGNLNFSGLSVAALQSTNLLPINFDPTNSNPWGLSFGIAPNSSDNTRFDITMNVPKKSQADKLSTYFKSSAASSAYDESKATWTATF